MNVALYEGTWEKYHSSDDFASSTNESNYFLGEVINWGNELFGCGIDLYKTGQNPGDAFAHCSIAKICQEWAKCYCGGNIRVMKESFMMSTVI